MPWWVLGWDVVCWLGQRRFARHWSVGQLRAELADTYQICLSADAIETYIHRYQQMLAARRQAPDQLATAYADVEAVMLTIDGLQPEKGHETLYVVRELERKRVWFAEPLLSSATTEVQLLLVQAQAYRQEYGFNAITLLPVNLYGPWDNFDLQTSHVIPALIRKERETNRAAVG